MASPDFNLLITLDAVLSEGSVARAARHLRLSPSAMSRALARLRTTTGDPLLVRAGRGLVPTPHALALRDRVRQLVGEVESVLTPAGELDLRGLQRTFTLRTREGFVENFGAELLARVRRAAPQVRLSFVQKPDKESAPLRDGTVDLETGVVTETTSPELRTRALFHDRLIGVVRKGHPLSRRRITAKRYAQYGHISFSRYGIEKGEIDDALKPVEREIVANVASFSAALSLARATDLIATLPERHTGNLRSGMHSFALPFPVPGFTVSLLWHPRLDADPAHRWLRSIVIETCAKREAASHRLSSG